MLRTMNGYCWGLMSVAVVWRYLSKDEIYVLTEFVLMPLPTAYVSNFFLWGKLQYENIKKI